jgi:hypothetical protein
MLQQVEIAMNTMATIPENAQPLLSTNLPKSHKSLKLIITIFSYVVFIACIIMQFITLLSGGSGTKLPDNTGNNASSGLIACSPGISLASLIASLIAPCIVRGGNTMAVCELVCQLCIIVMIILMNSVVLVINSCNSTANILLFCSNLLLLIVFCCMIIRHKMK